MVIQLSPELSERVKSAAKSRGIQPEKLVEDAVKQYVSEGNLRVQVSETRRQLDELVQHMREPADFDAAVHAAKRRAGQLLEDNADWIDYVTRKGTEGGKRKR